MLRLSKIAHRACFLMSRSVYMTCCCGCCSALRPRYKRLVDNIFPASPQEGLVKSNMDKLTFYSLSSPEKLDRIGEYLFLKASRDIYRKRHGFVIIAMEAMDQLLLACHSQTLNLFVESFLKMVQKLLESADPTLHILATQSFVTFANIEEDTPSYHRRYDFFVSKFSAMCHSNHKDKSTRDKIRLAGIRGLQGVIRKTVSDDLVENIWEAQHMDKIVPSLLYNMQSAEKYETLTCLDANREDIADNPALLAEVCLRELVGRASFPHIPSVLRPALTHFDRHELWVPIDFAVHTFKVIMYSIQGQYTYRVVEALLQHVETGGAAGGRGVRAARAAVLRDIIAIAAQDTIGPSVLEIINNLLTHLRTSVARDTDKEADEKLYQEALINALGEFADHLPDYQKIDIMMFIVSKIPPASQNRSKSRTDIMLQSILLKSLLKVGATYKTTEYNKAFPSAFLESLLRLSSCVEAGTRPLLQKILHTLLDRHHNVARLHRPTLNFAELGLTIEKCSRQDIIFINKHGVSIYSSLYEGLQLESNTLENAESIFTTIALLICELACDETLSDIIQLIMSIQSGGVNNPVQSRAQQCRAHAIVASLLSLVSYTVRLPRLADYVDQVIEARREEAPYLLPPLLEDYSEVQSPNKSPVLMFDQMAICEILSSCGVQVTAAPSTPYSSAHRHSLLMAGTSQARDSLADITAPGNELDSANSSPGVQRPYHTDAELDEEYRKFVNKHNCQYDPPPGFGTYHPVQSESMSLEAIRRLARPPTEVERREAEKRRIDIQNTFKTATFSELIDITQPKFELREKVEELLRSAPTPPANKTHSDNLLPHHKYFPELFLY